MSLVNDKWGERTHGDGKSRPFTARTSRDVVAEVLARREGRAEIRPGHWVAAGAIVRALKDAGWVLGQRDRNSDGSAA